MIKFSSLPGLAFTLMIAANSFAGANYCQTPGPNQVICGDETNYCLTNGEGAACGGEANYCVTNGSGGACGGRAN